MPFELSVLSDKGVPTGGDQAEIDYLPFGVKTLKVVVSGKHKGKLRLRPLRFSPTAGEKFGHEDGDAGSNFVVSWGGGKEDYFELNYPKKRVAYFLVHHVGEPVEKATLTIVAADPKKGDEAILPVSLAYPTNDGPWDPGTVSQARWVELKSGLDGEADLLLQSRSAPEYIPRWWPPHRVNYIFDGDTPRVRLHYRRQVDGVNGRLTVHLARNDGSMERPVAVVEGSIAYPLYDMRQVAAELYHFGGQTWVLRLWFFWLDLELSRDDLGRYWLKDPADLESAWQGITAKSEGGTANKRWRKLHEIPDAERVDLLFDDDLDMICAGTDLHWRELWGMFTPETPGELLQAKIMDTRAAKLSQDHESLWNAIEGWGTVILSKWAKNKLPYKPHKQIEKELKKEGKLAANAVVMESHTPAFRNWTVALRYTSTDVTDG